MINRTEPCFCLEVNAITNGEVVLEVFKWLEYRKDIPLGTVAVLFKGQEKYVNFELDWWDAPYK